LQEEPPPVPDWHFYIPTDSAEPTSINATDLDALSLLFMEAMQYKTTRDLISSTLSLSEYKGKLKIWDERTSTSPSSNMHLGHLKAYWEDHTLDGMVWQPFLGKHTCMFLCLLLMRVTCIIVYTLKCLIHRLQLLSGNLRCFLTRLYFNNTNKSIPCSKRVVLMCLSSWLCG
jgi:hypothetical protein